MDTTKSDSIGHIPALVSFWSSTSKVKHFCEAKSCRMNKMYRIYGAGNMKLRHTKVRNVYCVILPAFMNYIRNKIYPSFLSMGFDCHLIISRD